MLEQLDLEFDHFYPSIEADIAAIRLRPAPKRLAAGSGPVDPMRGSSLRAILPIALAPRDPLNWDRCWTLARSADRRHFLVAQLEVEDLYVLANPLRRPRLGYGDVAELHVPAQDHLGG